MQKAAIMSVYIGKFPSYHHIAKKSMFLNNDYDFLIFTDQVNSITKENNVTYIPTSYEDICNRLSSKLNTPIKINHYYKLVDTKPAWGDMFLDYLSEYKWWGFADLDIIYGNLNKFLLPEAFECDLITYITLSKRLHGPFTLLSMKHIELYKEIPDIAHKMNTFDVENNNEVYYTDEVYLRQLVEDKQLNIYTKVVRNNTPVHIIRYGKRRTPATWINGEFDLETYREDYKDTYDYKTLGCDTMLFHVRPYHKVSEHNGTITITTKHEDTFKVTTQDNIYLPITVNTSHFHLIAEIIPTLMYYYHTYGIIQIHIEDVRKRLTLQRYITEFKLPFVCKALPKNEKSFEDKLLLRFDFVKRSMWEFYRKDLYKDDTLPKKIVINRKKDRRIPPDIIQYLADNDFVELFFEDYSIKEQSQFIFNAEYMIASHGAAEVNIIFANENLKVLELNAGYNLKCFTRFIPHISRMIDIKIQLHTLLSEPYIKCKIKGPTYSFCDETYELDKKLFIQNKSADFIMNLTLFSTYFNKFMGHK